MIPEKGYLARREPQSFMSSTESFSQWYSMVSVELCDQNKKSIYICSANNNEKLVNYRKK